ncbi:hypothetical protein ACQCN2_09500 [Brevibacillus ginsengisoli]|uniref:hypothetical protein n=1 Tax=Brevibacillus ginsengisoli TaxID=363854 RepID=UPI003CEBF004
MSTRSKKKIYDNNIIDRADAWYDTIQTFLNWINVSGHDKMQVITSVLNENSNCRTELIKEEGYSPQFFEWLREYLSTPYYINGQNKGSKSKLAENDYFSRLLEMFSNYLLFNDNYKGLEHPYYNKKEFEYRSRKNLSESRFLEKEEVADQIPHEVIDQVYYEAVVGTKNRKNRQFVKYDKSGVNKTTSKIRYSKVKEKITEVDKMQYPQLGEIYKQIGLLNEVLIKGKYEDGREVEPKIVNRYIIQLKREALSILKHVKYKQFPKSSIQEIDLYENGNIDFGNSKHIRAIIDSYKNLESKSKYNTQSYLFQYLTDFNDLLNRTELSEAHNTMIRLKMDFDHSDKYITKKLNDDGYKYTRQAITHALNTYIPKKIADQFIYEQRIFQAKQIKDVNWTNCNGECGKNLPMTQFFFRKGRSKCKKCESSEKLKNKLTKII